MGIVYTNIEDMAPHLGPSIITIGDVVTSIFEAAGIPPDISIIDQLTEREPINFPRPFSHLDPIFKINNPPGVLTEELVQAIHKAIQHRNKPCQILIIGEEDLSTLPAIMLASIGTSIIYGQPNRGMVHVLVTTTIKQTVWDILSNFDGNLSSVFSMGVELDL